MGEWSAEYRAKPLLLNAERSSHFSVRAAFTSEWREAFGWLWRESKVPRLVSCVVHVDHYTRTANLPDVVACCPAAKPAIDALVDIGILPDDGPRYVLGVLFRPPQKRGYDAVRLTVIGEPA